MPDVVVYAGMRLLAAVLVAALLAPARPAVAAPPDSAGTTSTHEVRALIERALSSAGGRVYGASGAAAILGLRPTTLQGKMKKYGVQPGARGRTS